LKTIIKKANENDTDVILEAAGIIKNGGLVAFPTETVYGLGADGFNAAAVRKIFGAKGRPQDNPLILHISHIDMLNAVSGYIPDTAYSLAKAFWPGPLTMVLKKSGAVPCETSCGLDTIAVRLPENKIAGLLIKYSGRPVAAPSANISGRPSPTQARYVIDDLSGKIDMIIDGGPCAVGIESTIVDLTEETPVILRPGIITREMIKNVAGRCGLADANGNEKPKAPGMKYKHYAPQAKLTVVTGSPQNIAAAINAFIKKDRDIKTGVLATEETFQLYDDDAVILCAGSGLKPDDIARNLFNLLREFDEKGVKRIFAEGLAETGVAASVMNRLQKAAGYDIMYTGGDML